MSTEDEIRMTYDLGVDFFKLWLDAKLLYTCGLHEGTSSEEEAQLKKLEWICRAARIKPGTRVLDIGCGWGGCLEYCTGELGVEQAHGITLSRDQFEAVQRKAMPNAILFHGSYLDYQPELLFDAAVSIGMLEHVVSPKELRAGKQIEIYRNYFRLVHSWTKADSWFGLQLIHTVRIPRDRRDLEDLVWGSGRIFPGASAPRMEAVIQAMNPYWEVMEVRTRREDYSLTTAEWLRRFRSNENTIREKWGGDLYQDYERYLRSCVRMFEKGYMSLGQYSLRRKD